MSKPRDYKAEYARRIARGLEKGLSRSQARGHPGAGHTFISGKALVARYDALLEDGVKFIRNGGSLTQAAKAIQTTPERLRNYLIAQGVGLKDAGRWKIGLDSRPRRLPLFSEGKELVITVRGYDPARQVGLYMHAVRQFLDTNDPAPLEQFRGQAVVDITGHRYLFETDENTLYKLHTISDSTFESIYRIVA